MRDLPRLPADLLSAADYARHAAQHLDAATLAWLEGGSGEELTLQANLQAFARYQPWPRLLSDCAAGSTATTLLGRALRHPFVLAPVGWQALVHADGERATARAAAATDTLMVLSTLSSCALEEVASELPGDKWFQLYWQPSRTVTLDLLQRAEAAGYTAIVLTLDVPVQPQSLRAQRAGFQLPPLQAAGNFRRYAPQRLPVPDRALLCQGALVSAPTWQDLRWLLAQTRLPVLVKGVLHAEDAVRLRDTGVAGLVVSNHGGRSLDGVPATLDVLPLIRAAVGADYPLLLDGGVRRGRDAFVACALGANAVLLGRPQLQALAVGGDLGVAHLLSLLRAELELCLALSGQPSLQALPPDVLRKIGC